MSDDDRLAFLLRINERLSTAPIVQFGLEDWLLPILDKLAEQLERLERRMMYLERRLPPA